MTVTASAQTLAMTKYYLYILASRHHRHLSVGVTVDLVSGISGHRTRVSRRLNKRRVLQKLVYVETICGLEEAVARQVRLNRASRAQLEPLIQSVNPGWDSISLSALVEAGYAQV